MIRAVFIGLAFFWLMSAAYNANEAHQHSHEIGCAVGLDHYCKFVR